MSELPVSDCEGNDGLLEKKAVWSISPRRRGEAAEGEGSFPETYGEGVLTGTKGEDVFPDTYGDGVLPAM
jgi:hypothetical protein